MNSDKGDVAEDGGQCSGQLNAPSMAQSERSPDSKRQEARRIIERYFYQLLNGCGKFDCSNENCATGGNLTLDPNEAAAFAIRLSRQDIPFCIDDRKLPKGSTSTITNCSPECGSTCEHRLVSLNECKLIETLKYCQSTGVYGPIIVLLGQVFSRYDFLGKSFLQTTNNPQSLSSYTTSELNAMHKEKVRELEGEPEKDVDSSMDMDPAVDTNMETANVDGSAECSSSREVDMLSAQRTIKFLFENDKGLFEHVFLHALTSLAATIETELQFQTCRTDSKDLDLICNALLLAFELPAINHNDYLLEVLPRLCKAVSFTPVHIQAKIAMTWARFSQIRIQALLIELHSIITLKVIGGSYSDDFSVHDEISIISATKIMKILYFASILAGELDPPELRDDEPILASSSYHPVLQYTEDPLEKELKVSVLDSRKPLIPFTRFYSTPLSDNMEMDKDFHNYKDANGAFSFMQHSFVLSPATKIHALYYDCRVRMYNERNMSYLRSDKGQSTNPYLRLKVHRDRIVEDALIELELIATHNPKDFKKQLVVEFAGEQGIDEGGISKEFFQLIVEEIFKPDYGMFVWHEDSNTYWFNPMSFESEAQFTLIGIVIGLAIYNNVILQVDFPTVVYRKLMGKKGCFADLLDWNQTLYNSFQYMLDYSEDSFEEVFMQTFRISYSDVFGNIVYHDLIQDGDSVPVTTSNRKKFVDLYVDYLINKSIEKQFKAFKKGFVMVTDESPLHLLFRPEEIELLVCGSKSFNIKELEEVTEYDGGYSAQTPLIRHFWEIVHAMCLNSQRKLLQFATGSDRVPVGGFCKSKLIIARNGPDSDRLPTAHTCYNILLLPEYASKEKLEDRLMKAINYSKGFGML